jgi:hypothetical protein
VQARQGELNVLGFKNTTKSIANTNKSLLAHGYWRRATAAMASHMAGARHTGNENPILQ